MAKALVRALEPFRPMFFEEPVPPENLEALREVARHTTVPIALGERLFTRWGFRQVLTEGVADVIQPDLSHAGGIWEVRKIAAMAEAFDVAVAPHCPLGPIAFAASVQLDACTPNAIIQEQSLGIHYNVGNDLLDYLADPTVFRLQDGYLAIPDGPGLGIEIDERLVRERARQGHDWRNPVWRNADGHLRLRNCGGQRSARVPRISAARTAVAGQRSLKEPAGDDQRRSGGGHRAGHRPPGVARRAAGR